MKRVFVLTVACLSAVLLTVPAQAQNLWVRGPVTAMGAETLTVTVKGVEHVFKNRPGDHPGDRPGRHDGHEGGREGQALTEAR